MANQVATDAKRDNTKKKEKSPEPKPPEQDVSQGEEAMLAWPTIKGPRVFGSENLLALQRTAGNRAVRRMIQHKLVVGAANDPYEQEADRVAGQVMRAPLPQEEHPGSGQHIRRADSEDEQIDRLPVDGALAISSIQRAPVEEEKPAPPGASSQAPAAPTPEPAQALGSAEEEEEVVQPKLLVQRAGAHDSFEVNAQFENQLGATRGQGSRLPDETRSEMESRFGIDLGSVRVHTGGAAEDLNRSVAAQAFTLGSDIYFGAGKYDPGSTQGKHLLAHELTHVVQQSGGVRRKLDIHAALPSIQRKDTDAAKTADKNKLKDWVTDKKADYIKWAKAGARKPYFDDKGTPEIDTWEAKWKGDAQGAGTIGDLKKVKKDASTAFDEIKSFRTAKAEAWKWIVDQKAAYDDWIVAGKRMAFFQANNDLEIGPWETKSKDDIHNAVTETVVGTTFTALKKEYNDHKALKSGQADAWVWVNDKAKEFKDWKGTTKPAAYYLANADTWITDWETNSKAAIVLLTGVDAVANKRADLATEFKDHKSLRGAQVDAWTFIIDSKKEFNDWKAAVKGKECFTAAPVDTSVDDWETASKPDIVGAPNAADVGTRRSVIEEKYKKLRAWKTQQAKDWVWIAELKQKMEVWAAKPRPKRYFDDNAANIDPLTTWFDDSKTAIKGAKDLAETNQAATTLATAMDTLNKDLADKAEIFAWKKDQLQGIIDSKKKLSDWGKADPRDQYYVNGTGKATFDADLDNWEATANTSVNTAADLDALRAAVKKWMADHKKLTKDKEDEFGVYWQFKSYKEGLEADAKRQIEWSGKGKKAQFFPTSGIDVATRINAWKDTSVAALKNTIVPYVVGTSLTNLRTEYRSSQNKLNEELHGGTGAPKGIRQAYQEHRRGEYEQSIKTTGPHAMLPPVTQKEKGPGAFALNVLKSVGKGLFSAALYPLKYTLLFNKEERAGETKEWNANYGTSGGLAKLLQFLNRVNKVVSEIGGMAGWLALLFSIIGAALSWAGGAGVAFAAAVPILTIIGLACNAFTFVMKLILVIRNATRLSRLDQTLHAKARAMTKAQIWRDAAASFGALIGVISGGAFTNINPPSGGTGYSMVGGGSFTMSYSDQVSNVVQSNVGNVFAMAGMGQVGGTVSNIVNDGLIGQKADIIRKSPLPGITSAPAAIQRQGEDGQTPTQGPEDQKAEVEEALKLVGEISGLGKEEQVAEKDEIKEFGETQEALTDSKAKYDSDLKQFVEVKTKAGEVKEAAEKGEASSEGIDKDDDSKTEEKAQLSEEKLALAEKAANRDPESVNKDEVKTAYSEAQTSIAQAPTKKKRGLFRRLGTSIMTAFANIKRRIKQLIAKAKAKIVELVLKATGADEPVREFGTHLESGPGLVSEADTAIKTGMEATTAGMTQAEEVLAASKKGGK